MWKWSVSFIKNHAYIIIIIGCDLATVTEVTILFFSPKSWQRAAICTHSSSLGGIKGWSFKGFPSGPFTGSRSALCFSFNPFINSVAMWQTLHRERTLWEWSYYTMQYTIYIAVPDWMFKSCVYCSWVHKRSTHYSNTKYEWNCQLLYQECIACAHAGTHNARALYYAYTAWSAWGVGTEACWLSSRGNHSVLWSHGWGLAE